jgi:hypothetical protein
MSVLCKENVIDMFELAIKNRVKKTGEIAITFAHEHKIFAYVNRDEMNIQMKMWRTQQKKGLLKIKRFNSNIGEYNGNKYYYFVVQPYKNGKMMRCNIDPMGAFIFGKLVSGYIYAFIKEENRDAVEKYVMGGKYDEEQEEVEDSSEDEEDEEEKKKKHFVNQKKHIINMPQFLDLMWNVIDNSIRLEDSKYIIKMKYPELVPFTTDDVIDRSARLYHLSKKLKSHIKRNKKTNKLYFS